MAKVKAKAKARPPTRTTAKSPSRPLQPNPLPATNHLYVERPTRPGMSDERPRIGMLPISMHTTTHTNLVQLSRVPCVGEIVHMATSERESGGRDYRVVCVQHLAPVIGHSWEVVAEIHCIEVEDLDVWDGQFPSPAGGEASS
jgi:hypothetical protein